MILNRNNYKFYTIQCQEESDKQNKKKDVTSNIEFNIYIIANLMVSNGNEVRIIMLDKDSSFYYCHPFYCIEFYLLQTKNCISRSICLFKLVNEKIILDEKGIHNNSFILTEKETPYKSWEKYEPPKIIRKLVFGWTINSDNERIYLLTTQDGMVKILNTSFIKKEGETFHIISRYWNNLIKYKIVFDEIPFLMNNEFFMQSKQDKDPMAIQFPEDKKKDTNNESSDDSIENDKYAVQQTPFMYKVNLTYYNNKTLNFSFKVIFEQPPKKFDVIYGNHKGYLFVYDGFDLAEFWIENGELLQQKVKIGYSGYYWLDFEGTFYYPFTLNGFILEFKNIVPLFDSLDSNVEEFLKDFEKAEDPKIIWQPEEMARSYLVSYQEKFLGVLYTKKNEIRLKKFKDNGNEDYILHNNITYTVNFFNKKRKFLENPQKGKVVTGKFTCIQGNLIILTEGFTSKIRSLGLDNLESFNKALKAKLILS